MGAIATRRPGSRPRTARRPRSGWRRCRARREERGDRAQRSLRMRRPRRRRAQARVWSQQPRATPGLGYRRMVRERVGDWRSAWQSALAGLGAGLLVLGVLQSAVLNPSYFAAQDRLFPAPHPDSRITLVALDQESEKNLGGYPLVSNAYHAQVIDYL